MKKRAVLESLVQGDIVEVFWLDAFWVSGNSYRTAWDNDSKQYTFGVVAGLDNGLVRIAHEFDADGTYRGVTNVPRKYIETVTLFGHTETTLP